MYLVTGFIGALDICYELKKEGKDFEISDTSWVVILSMFLWLPAIIFCFYGYACKALWEISTEEEDDE